MSVTKLTSLLVFSLFATVYCSDGPCFKFDNNYLEFYPDDFDISDSIHYKLNFKTSHENGTILYARGSHDYEGLFVYKGKLIYHIVNPTYHGTGGSFGAIFRSNERVDNSTWFTVEIFRNRRIRRGSSAPSWERPPIQSGLFLKAARSPHEERHVMSRRLEGVELMLPLYVGGAGSEMSHVEHFNGQIKNIQEKRHDTVLKYPSRNFNVLHCIDTPEPV